MRLFVDCGHGEDYRQSKEMDYGLTADDGTRELAIVRAYGRCLQETMQLRGHRCSYSTRHSITHRLRDALHKHRAQCLISLHMGYCQEAAPGGRVLFSTGASEPVARALGAALGFPVEHIEAEGDHKILLLNPSVEIELANIACWADMKRLRCAADCQKLCEQIADTLESLFLRA
jgi:N-acetylmuramoyl-L-alanine amidase